MCWSSIDCVSIMMLIKCLLRYPLSDGQEAIKDINQGLTVDESTLCKIWRKQQQPTATAIYLALLTIGTYFIPNRILNDAVYNFPNNQEEITLCVCPETFKVKNYVDDEPGKKLKHVMIYLTIIRRRRSEYCRIIPETRSRGLFDNIHWAWGE